MITKYIKMLTDVVTEVASTDSPKNPLSNPICSRDIKNPVCLVCEKIIRTENMRINIAIIVNKLVNY